MWPIASPLPRLRRRPRPTLFPYTTLFRSGVTSDGIWGRDTEAHWQTLRSQHKMASRSEEHTSELQSRGQLVCRLLREKKKRLDQHTNRMQMHRGQKDAGPEPGE